MADLLKILESFNRKERFFLISHALQGPQGKPVFTLSDDFRGQLEQKLEFDFAIPADAFVAMDYHLDWVAASLAKWESDKAGKVDESIFPNPGQKVVEGNQEDIDLLVAFNRGGQYHLIFVEAKAYEGDGFASFKRDQLESKSDRLVKIFGDNGQKYGKITPHFCLLSPKDPTPQSPYPWPWDKDKWLQLSIRDKCTRRVVERYDKDAGKASADGNHFHIRSLK